MDNSTQKKTTTLELVITIEGDKIMDIFNDPELAEAFRTVMNRYPVRTNVGQKLQKSLNKRARKRPGKSAGVKGRKNPERGAGVKVSGVWNGKKLTSDVVTVKGRYISVEMDDDGITVHQSKKANCKTLNKKILDVGDDTEVMVPKPVKPDCEDESQRKMVLKMEYEPSNEDKALICKEHGCDLYKAGEIYVSNKLSYFKGFLPHYRQYMERSIIMHYYLFQETQCYLYQKIQGVYYARWHNGARLAISDFVKSKSDNFGVLKYYLHDGFSTLEELVSSKNDSFIWVRDRTMKFHEKTREMDIQNMLFYYICIERRYRDGDSVFVKEWCAKVINYLEKELKI